MLSAFFSSLADYFRSQIFDDPTASAQAANFDALADVERTQEAFHQTDMFDHGSNFDHSAGMFDHSSSFGSDSFGGGSSSFD